MKAFLDTSSVLKLYHQEDGTEALVTSLSTGIRPLYLSELAVLEFRSAVWKKTRTREIDTLIAKQVIAGFQRDFVKFQWIRLDSHLLWQASDLLMKYAPEGLRTLDAIQLASALSLKGQPQVYFFTADQLLKSFFEKEGLWES